MWFNFFLGFLTVVLVLDCLFLLLLILIQLPKKEAGLGQAFGSSTTDALFGAGSGSALTKMTKYSAIIFFGLTFLLAILNAQQSKAQRGGRLREALSKMPATQPVAPVTSPGSNAPAKMTLPALNLTNAPTVVSNIAAEAPPPKPAPAASTNKPAAPK